MKNNTIRFAFLLLVMQLGSCEKERQKTEQNISGSKVLATSNGSDSQVSNLSFGPNNSYYVFFLKIYPQIFEDKELLYFEEKDIDLDGQKEAIIALGYKDKEDPTQTNVDALFLLKNDHGTIREISYDFINDVFYSVYDVKLISLQGIKKSYIYLGLTNGSYLQGFALFELINNKVKKKCISASGTGAGDDELVDSDRNGEYDGYVKSRNGSDALHYQISANFVFEKEGFKSVGAHVIIPNYPSNIHDILLQYLSLRSLDSDYFGESDEVNIRLNQLCVDETAAAIPWNKIAWGEGYLKNYMESDDQIKFDIQEDNNTATALAKYSDENQRIYQCQFQLQQSNNKWQITKVEVTKKW